MADKIIENNQVSVMGRIATGFTFSHQVFGEGFYMMDILVKRLSDSEDRIPVMVSERLIDITQDYVGEYIEIHGQFRSYNRHEEKKNRLVLSVFVRELEFTEEELIKRKMYPLIPLQLFSLRKELEVAQKKNDIVKIQQLSVIAKNLATKLANESKELFCENEILGEDFHKMLLAIQNLIEYLNRNYFNDDKLEEEVITMTKSLYDPEVEKQGIQKGIQKGIKQGIKQGIEQGIKQGEKKKSIEIAKKGILKGLDNETIMDLTELSIEEIELIRKEMSLN